MAKNNDRDSGSISYPMQHIPRHLFHDCSGMRGGTKLVYGVGMQYGMDSSDAARARYCVNVILKVH